MEEEKDYWAIRSNLNWTLYGERNSKFFQNYVKYKRRRNIMTAIKNEDENWIMDKEHIAVLFLTHFKAIFQVTTHSIPEERIDIPSNLPSAPQFSHLIEIPTQQEIKAALFDMGPLKSPGPDGFHPIFFQRSWDILASAITEFIQTVFKTATFSSTLNTTTLCLIPKCTAPTKVEHFRPISLCNTIYKLITKILVNCLKPIMPSLITPHQSGFVKGR